MKRILGLVLVAAAMLGVTIPAALAAGTRTVPIESLTLVSESEPTSPAEISGGRHRDRYDRDRHDRDRHDRDRYDRDRHDRDRHDRHRYDRDRHDRHRYDRDRHDRYRR